MNFSRLLMMVVRMVMRTFMRRGMRGGMGGKGAPPKQGRPRRPPRQS